MSLLERIRNALLAALLCVACAVGEQGDSSGSIPALWAGAQQDLAAGHHEQCAAKFSVLYTTFLTSWESSSSSSLGEDSQVSGAPDDKLHPMLKLSVQSLVNQGVCLQASKNMEGYAAAAKSYRAALALAPGFEGAVARLCALLVDSRIEKYPGERLVVCSGHGHASARPQNNADGSTSNNDLYDDGVDDDDDDDERMDQCDSLFVTPGNPSNQEHSNIFMQPRYSAWWLAAGMLRSPTEVERFAANASAMHPANPPSSVPATWAADRANLLQRALRSFVNTKHYFAAVFDAVANRHVHSLRAKRVQEIQMAFQMDRGALEEVATTGLEPASEAHDSKFYAAQNALNSIKICMSRAVGRLTRWVESSLLQQASYQATLAAAIILPQSLEIFPRRYRALVAAVEAERGTNVTAKILRFSSPEVLAKTLTISAVVPCHNCAAGIQSTLEAIEASFDHFLTRRFPTNSEEISPKFLILEIVVVDDHSADNSSSVANSTLSQIIERFQRAQSVKTGDLQDSSSFHSFVIANVIRNVVNVGAGASRNIGVNASRGDIIFFCDSEDLWHPSHLATCTSSLLGNKYNAMAMTNIQVDMTSAHYEVVAEDSSRSAHGSWTVHPSWNQLIRNTIPSNKCVQRWAHDFVMGFPDQDPIFRQDGEDQAYLTAMTTFFQVALPANDQAPLVTYVYQSGHNLDRRREQFSRPRSAFQPTVFDREVQGAVTHWVDGIAAARGVLSEIHDLLVVSARASKVAAPNTSNISVRLKPADFYESSKKGANFDKSGPECNLSWLECLSKELNPLVQPLESKPRLVQNEQCRQQPLFTFETLGFLHNQVTMPVYGFAVVAPAVHAFPALCTVFRLTSLCLRAVLAKLVSLNNAIRLCEWMNYTLVLPARTETVLGAYLELTPLRRHYCVMSATDPYAQRAAAAGKILQFSSEDVFFLRGFDEQGLFEAANSHNEFFKMGRELHRQAPLPAAAFHDFHFGKVLGVLFAEPLPAVRAAIEGFLFHGASERDPRLPSTPACTFDRHRGSSGFAAVHLRWSEATCSLRMHRQNHHPSVSNILRGLGPCFMHPEYVASRVLSVARELGLRAEWNASKSLCDLPWKVFLGSDGQRPDREAQLQDSGAVRIDPQAETFFPDGDPLGLGPVVVDFLLMSLSAVFLGNPVSTFSINIASLRAHLGHAATTSVLYEAREA